MAVSFDSTNDKFTGTNVPMNNMYSSFGNTSQVPGATTTLDTQDLLTSVNLNVFDPAGAASRPLKGVQGPWADPTTLTSQNGQGGTYYKYNQMMMTFAQSFDPFIQRKELETPRWWVSRIPRGAFKLFDGYVHETRIYRGGLSTYAGLSQWEDINPIADGSNDPCAPLKYDTYQYAWEAMAWKGKRAGWGSDPICVDALKFVPQAVQQLGWILDTGAKYGLDMQEVWNRDMFIFQTVMAGHSFMMTSEFTGVESSPRYIYNPFVKFQANPTNGGSDGIADSAVIDKPFIVFDASVSLEPLNFDVLDQVREYLKTACPEAAVGRLGSDPMFALAVSQDDVERYIRGNEEERKYWIEANPQALIQHYGFAPTTFRRWSITNDGNQLRFKIKSYIASYTSSVAKSYGNVGLNEFENKAVYIAEFVPPRKAGRPGINGAPIPVVNEEYYRAEVAIAPVFMNKVFTNLFVPASPTTLGSGTYFGPVPSLNGKWGWRNILSYDKNPDGKIGNFYGEFEIIPKPDVCVYESFSFIYRRCVKALPSLCPAENVSVNHTSKASTTVVSAVDLSGTSATKTSYSLTVADNFGVGVGDQVTLTISDSDSATGYVLSTQTPHVFTVQFTEALDADPTAGAAIIKA